MKIAHNPIIKYFQSSFSELKKVTWPTRKQIISLTIMVVISIGIATLIVMGLDYLLTKVINFIIKK